MSSNIPRWFFINPFAWCLIALDVALIALTFKWVGLFKRFSPRVTVGSNGAVRLATGKPLANEGKGDTAWDLVTKAFAQYANKRSLGTRKYVGEYLEEGARFPKKQFGAISWRTYAEVAERARNIGKGLLAVGMKALPKDEGKEDGTKFEDTTAPHTALIYEETCADWLTFLFGAWSQSLAVATSYATLGVSSVADAVVECNVKVILCNYRDVEKVAAACTTMPTLTHIVYTTNNVTADDALKKPSVSNAVTVMSIDELIAVGSQSIETDNAPSPDNMAVVMYTSGSTGKPKGVMLRQKQVRASAEALRDMAEGTGLVQGKETYLAYLPAAHILELVAETTMFIFGAEIGYSDPKTISSKGACRLDEATGEVHKDAKMKYPADETQNFAPGGIQAFRPTFMAAVPKIWDILKKGVEEGLGAKPAPVQGLMKLGYAWRSWLLSKGMDSVVFKALFGKVKPILGGRQKLFVSGGGPIASEVQTFIRTMFGAPLVQGYALTETTCSGCVQYSSDPRDGVVGPPVSSVEIMLRSCVEAPEGDPAGKPVPSCLDRNGQPYLQSDTSHYGQKCLGRGEVLIRGPAVGSGYLKQADKTAEAFDTEGWFHSGDIAIFTPDGCIKIVDRLKNLVKLKGGEYIAIESMEKEYSKSIFVNALNGGIMCYGDGSMDRPVALVQANCAELRKWAASQGLSFDDDEALCRDPRVEAAALADLNKEGAKGGVSSLEKLIALTLISGHGDPNRAEPNSPWTPDNGFLTASNKLNRKPIQEGLGALLQPLILKGIR
jgi:long-chain acyl-CoA synthetase